MVKDEPTADRYFRNLREMRRKRQHERRTSDDFLKLVDLIIEATRRGETNKVLSELEALKDTIRICAPDLDDDFESTHADLIEMMMLRKRNRELSLELARLRGDDEAAAEYERLIGTMDEFFSASISDLDE